MLLRSSKLAMNIKCQLNNLNANSNTFTNTSYSHKLYKSIYIYIKYIRLYEKRTKSILKYVLIDLFDIKRMILQKISDFPDYECFENFLDIIIATIISIINIQFDMLFITKEQKSNYMKLVL